MPPKAILFDFDGVIAETENHHVAAWQRTASFMGLQINDEVAARSMEVDDREFLTDLFTEREIPVDKVDEWVARKQALTVELLRYAPRVYPGVVELVGALRGKARLAVVTGTWRENVETVLQAAGLADAFPLIVAKEDVERRKPDPEAYALALEEAPAVGAVGGGDRGLALGPLGRPRCGPPPPHRRSAIADPSGDWVGDADYLERLKPVEKVLEQLGF